MSVEAITDTIHEFVYEKNERDSEETKSNTWIEKELPKTRKRKTQTNSEKSIRCGAPNWNKQHDCPVKQRNV